MADETDTMGIGGERNLDDMGGSYVNNSNGRGGHGRAARLIGWIVAILVLFGGGAVFYYFSAANHDKFIVVKEDGQLKVRRGLFLPAGDIPYDGPAAYQPIDVPEDLSFTSKEFGNLKEVDRFLFDLLKKLINDAISDRSPQSLATARMYLNRVRLLGVADEEVDKLLAYKGDVALAEAQNTLASVIPIIERAIAQMKSAARHDTSQYGDPRLWIDWAQRRLAEFRSIDKALTPPAADKIEVSPLASEKSDAEGSEDGTGRNSNRRINKRTEENATSTRKSKADSSSKSESKSKIQVNSAPTPKHITTDREVAGAEKGRAGKPSNATATAGPVPEHAGSTPHDVSNNTNDSPGPAGWTHTDGQDRQLAPVPLGQGESTSPE